MFGTSTSTWMERWRRTAFAQSGFSFLISSALTLIILAMVACGGTDQRRYDRPDDTREVISDDDLADVADEGFEVHEGEDPPSLEGRYRWNSARWVEATDESMVGESACDGRLKIQQLADREVELTYTYMGDCDGSGRTRTDVVSGDGKCFTLYGQVDGQFEGCSHRSTILTSGCLTEEGIETYKRAIVNQSIGGSDRCQTLVEQRRMPAEGEFVIVSETDGLVERLQSPADSDTSWSVEND